MGLYQRVKSHPGIVVLAGVVGALAVVVGLANDFLGVLDHVPGSPSPSSSAAASPAATSRASSTGPSTTTETPEPKGVGACRTATWVSVGCDEDHSFEAFDGSCDADGVTAFLGGVPERDVLIAKAKTRDAQCWVRLPAPRQGTVRDALLERDSGAPLRACVDERSQRLVGCDQLHSGEYLATGETSRSASDRCEVTASSYMQRQLGDVSDVLRVRAVSHPERVASAPRCLIEVLGQRRLTTSVFALGTDAVPVEE